MKDEILGPTVRPDVGAGVLGSSSYLVSCEKSTQAVLSNTITNRFLFPCCSFSDTNIADREIQFSFSLSLMVMMFRLNQAALLIPLLVMWHVFAGTDIIMFILLSKFVITNDYINWLTPLNYRNH